MCARSVRNMACVLRALCAQRARNRREWEVNIEWDDSQLHACLSSACFLVALLLQVVAAFAPARQRRRRRKLLKLARSAMYEARLLQDPGVRRSGREDLPRKSETGQEK